MKRPWQPQVLRELHKIREEMYEEAKPVGFDKYYDALNEKSGWLLASEKKSRLASVVRERPSAKYKAR